MSEQENQDQSTVKAKTSWKEDAIKNGETDKNIELQLDGLITKASAQTSDTGEEFVMIEGYANTPSADRVRDVIPISTWQDPDALKSYLKNPIILAFHDHEKPIGKMEEYNVELS